MGFTKLIRLASDKFTTRKFHGTIERCSTWRNVMKKELGNSKCGRSEESDTVCIYRVPSNLRQVEPNAYRPNNISIGPYHNGARRLQKMQVLKKEFYRRLFDSNAANGSKLDEAFEALEGLEAEARRCYNDEIKLSSDEFLQMMLVDGSFIIQLLRDLSDCDFGQVPCLSRWMLPIIRKELIMLENQLPLFVLSKLFDLTNRSTTTTHASSSQSSQPSMSLKALALRFFYPLLLVDSDKFPECERADEFKGLHFLDLLRSGIRPKLEGENPRGPQEHMIRSATELIEAGVKIKADENRRVMDISFGKKWGLLMREPTIPPLYINDDRGTVFRNIVAFEKCHKECNPDVTTYLFFFNGLINSDNDVSLLHYKGVIYHSLGDDHAVAELVNNISKEMVRDKDESYLHEVVNGANKYYGKRYARIRASIVHNYLTSWVVGISTIGAALGLYLTLIQTVHGFAVALRSLEGKHFGSLFIDIFVTPFRGAPSPRPAGADKDSEAAAVTAAATEGIDDSNCRDIFKEFLDLCMAVRITE